MCFKALKEMIKRHNDSKKILRRLNVVSKNLEFSIKAVKVRDKEQKKLQEEMKIDDLICMVTPSEKGHNHWVLTFINLSSTDIRVLKISCNTHLELFGDTTRTGVDDTHMPERAIWTDTPKNKIVIRNLAAGTKESVERITSDHVNYYDRKTEFWMKVQVSFEGDSFPMKLVKVKVEVE
tara:strand:+ start:83 stop:619 length:537 start_codon:yes stop_codon:yes gene_type:complete